MKLLSTPLLLAAATLAAASSAHAADQSWTPGLTGDWDLSALNWGGSAWTQGNAAIFGGTPGSVSITEDITANGLTVSSNSATPYAFDIAAGKTLTVTGAGGPTPIVTIGANVADSTTNVAFTGLGSFTVNNSGGTFQVGGVTGTTAGSTVTLDMSGLSTFTANLGPTGIFRIGNTSTGSTNLGSSMALAETSTITAGTVNIGGTTGNQGLHTLTLGGAVNTINANTIVVGAGGPDATSGSRGRGEISFAPDTTGTLKIRAADGTGRTDLYVGSASGQTTGNNLTGVFDTAGHEADLLLGTLSIGNRVLTANPTTTTGVTTGTFSFGSEGSKLDVQTITMGQRMFNNGSNAVNATLNLSGGEVKIGAFGNLGEANNNSAVVNATVNITGGDVTIGTAEAKAHINMAVSAGANGTVTSTINITGGTVTQFGNITRNNTASRANATATLTLDGGSLDMTGHNIGGAGEAALTNVNLRSGTLKNLAQLNGGGVLTKTTAGTLTLSGTNTYTGGTTISAGTLVAGSNTALGSGSVNVGTAGAILQIGSTGVTLGNGANLAVVDGATIKLGGLVAGALNGVGSVITLDGGTFNFNAAGQLDLGGVLNNLAAGDYTYRLISGAAGAGNTDFMFANITGYDASVSGLDYSNGVLSFTAVPEPSTYGLIGAGALAAVAFVRRRRKHAGAVAA